MACVEVTLIDTRQIWQIGTQGRGYSQVSAVPTIFAISQKNEPD